MLSFTWSSLSYIYNWCFSIYTLRSYVISDREYVDHQFLLHMQLVVLALHDGEVNCRYIFVVCKSLISPIGDGYQQLQLDVTGDYSTIQNSRKVPSK